MTRPALIALALLLTAAGLWALASKPAAAYVLGGLDSPNFQPNQPSGEQHDHR